MFRKLGRNLAQQAVRCYAKDIRFGWEARNMLLQGVDIMADAVASTMGPHGRNAIIERMFTSPHITKEGGIVSSNVQLRDKRQNMGAELVRLVAKNTKLEVGDGTTTAIILARGMVRQGLQVINDYGINPHELREGMLRAAVVVCNQLRNMSHFVESTDEIAAVACISLNGDEELAELVGDGVNELRKGGTFLIKETKKAYDELMTVSGIELRQGYMSRYFINQTKSQKVEFTDALLLLTLEKISKVEQLLPALELAKQLEQPLIIIAKDVCDEAMSMLILNRLQLDMPVCAVKAPNSGEQQTEVMQDLAIATGGTLFGDEENSPRMHSFEEKDFGRVGEAVIDQHKTYFLHADCDQKQAEARADYIKELIGKADTNAEVEQLTERLGYLLSSVAVFYVGGSNQLEITEKKERLQNALSAIMVGINDGIVPGGGTAYLRCMHILENLPCFTMEQELGASIVKNALRLPCATIARNAGVDADEVLRNVLAKSGNYGYDAAAQEYGDLIERGIVDPTTVLCTALNYAVGISSLLATTELLVTEQPQETTQTEKEPVRETVGLKV